MNSLRRLPIFVAVRAIIPVAGMGMRLRPHTYTQPKPLIPVAGKPILGFIVDRLIAAGFTDFIFIIGYFGEKIEEYVNSNYPGISASFVLQHSREGLGHAVWLARDLIKPDEEIFIALGDTIFEADLESVMKTPKSTLGVKKVDDPRKFGVAELDDSGNITKVIEKPEIPKSNMALVGLYKIRESAALMKALGENIAEGMRTQGEFHLTDAIMKLLNQGIKFGSFQVQNWYDCGRREVLLETNAIMLKKAGYASDQVPDFPNTIIVHPVSIAPGSEISNSIIGPNVTIGEHSVIKYAIIKDSIIGSYAELRHVVLEQSVVGSDTSIKGLRQSLNVGDNTEIDLS